MTDSITTYIYDLVSTPSWDHGSIKLFSTRKGAEDYIKEHLKDVDQSELEILKREVYN